TTRRKRPMTEPAIDSETPRRWLTVVVALVQTSVALAAHVFTVGRVASWMPGYPSLYALGPFTPPLLIRATHGLGPYLLVLALAAICVASLAPGSVKRWRHRLLWTGGASLMLLLVLYAYALFWVIRVSRY